MKIPPHLISLYIKTARRYKKLISKIQRETASSYQRKTFAQQLKKLGKKLQDLQLQLKIAAATGTVILILNTSPAQAQAPNLTSLGPFVKLDRLNNPLREPLFTGQEPALAVIDFDGDGDLDVVVGERDYSYGGYLRYFENKSSAGITLYEERLLSENPFDGIHAITPGVAPAFADIDKDGDMDLFLGQNGYVYNQTSHSGIEYYRNNAGNFTKQTGNWDKITKQGNPFENVTLGPDVRPVFIDFDKDGDQDVIIGSNLRLGYPTYDTQHLHYYNNDGVGNFTSSPITVVTVDTFLNSYGILSPAMADLDGDGDYDMVLGSYYYERILYFKQVTPGNFVEETGTWDPVAKTGNPFDGFVIGSNASPVFIDLNDDGHLDLFLADEENNGKYSDNIINYYKNSGNNVYEEIDGFENPFGGVYVKDYASPTLLDLDGDNELDAVIGNKYNGSFFDYDLDSWVYTYSTLTQYKKNEGVYEKVTGEDNAFENLEMHGYFAPQFADIDGDGDLDIISGGDYGEIAFFRNDDGEYIREYEFSPFAGIWLGYNEATANLVDIDNDGDLDLFATNTYGEIHFYKNEGTSTDPEFIEQLAENNPLQLAAGFTMSTWPPFLHFTDIDHDGDLDVLFQGMGRYQRAGEVLYFENTGTVEAPVFENHFEGLFPDLDDASPQLDFEDHDKDGDLDAFIGVLNGTVRYHENQNKIVITTVTATVNLYEFGGDPLIVEPNLTLSDPDNDAIVQATVTIDDFQAGETLSFTPQAGISGYFDTSTGVLTFRGKAPVKDYESLLRTVAFEIIEAEGGRKRPSKLATTARTISFAVYDIDFTNPAIVSKNLNVFTNTPPEIQPQPVKTFTGLIKTINLLDITSDAEDNLDPESFTIVKQPSSGAVATVAFVSSDEVNLNLNYDGIEFMGNDQLTIRACDQAGACTDRIITVNVESGIVVYNAVAPNSQDHDNMFMRIAGLGMETNRVSIYNRWGDKVYEVKNYENTIRGNSFKGLNNNGNVLASGTYFYKIETGKKVITGYLTLKQ